jgi:hypothetical protein
LQNLECIDEEIEHPGLEVYPLVRADSTMRIADLLLKSVGFVSRHEPDQPLEFGGTAFIVGIKMADNAHIVHLVTAKHVAEAIEPAQAVIAMNAKDGAPRFLGTGDQKWFYHPTEKDSVDVAVMPLGSPNMGLYDITFIPDSIFATDARIAEYNIGLGDELIIVGLFSRFAGTTYVTPIVRTGNIAMMPRDRLPVKGFGEMEAYLAESRSIGGLSGSPVFVRNTLKSPVKGPKGLSNIYGLGDGHLLGLMHGHWDLPVSFSATEQAEAANMGVSIIVPAKKILEVLHHPELAAMRKEHYEKQKAASTTADTSFAKPFTKEDFEAALKKASRKVAPATKK